MSPVRFEQSRDATRARQSAEFFRTPLGTRLEQAEMTLLRSQVDRCFGARGLMISAGNDWRLLDALPVQRRFMAQVTTEQASLRRPVCASPASILDPANLPFANGSFDVLVLFHALDLAVHPQQGLREAARVLSDDGVLIVTGFNPWSLWGLRRLFGRRRAPWTANFINPVRMTDWLALLDFRIHSTEFVAMLPWARAEAAPKTPGPFSRLVRLPVGGAWIIHARRQPAAMVGRGLRPVRRAMPLPARGVAPTANRAATR